MLNERILKKENILRGLKDNIILKPINSKQSLQKDADDGACDSNDIKLGNTATLEKSLFIDGLESAIEKYNYNSRNILNSKVNSTYANNKPNNINNNNASNVKNENVSFIRLTFNPTTMSSDSVVRLKKPSTTIFGSKETVNLLRHTKKNTSNNNSSNISREKQTYLEKLKQLEQKRNSANLSTDFICTELKIENENLILNEKTKEKINNFKANVNEKQGKKQHHQRDEHLINVNEINNEISSANAANNNNNNSNSSTKPEALNELIKTNNKYLIKSEETAYNGNISASTSSFYNNREISKLKNSIIKQKILLNNNNNNKNTEVNKNKNDKLNNNFIQAELVYNSSLTQNHNNRNFKKGSNHNNDVHFIVSYNEEKKLIHAYQNISGNNSKRSNQIGASPPGLDALLTSEKSKNQTILYNNNNNKSSLSNRNNNSEEVDYYYYNSSAYYNKVDDVKDSKSKVKKHEKLMPNENSFNLELIKTEDQLIKDQIKYLNNNYDLRLSNSKECLDEDYFSNNNYTDSKNTKIQILTQQQQQNQQSHDLSNNKLLLNNSNSNSKKKLNKISKQESISKLNIANNNHNNSNNNVEQEEENQNLPLNILKNQDLNKNSLDFESISKTNKKTSLKRLDINSTSNINSNNNNNANNTNESSSNLQTVNDVVLLREGKSELDKTLDVVLVKKKILKKRTKKKLNEASYLLESEPNLLNQTKFINELDEKELSNQQTSNREGLTRLNNKTHKTKARFETDGRILHSSNEDLTENSKFLNCLENNKKIIEKLYGNLNIFDAGAHNYHSNSPNRIESASSDSSLTMNLINSKEKNKILNPKHILSSSYNTMGNPKSLNALHWINIATTGQNYKTKAELKAESANSASTKKSKELIRTLNNETVVSFVESRSNASTPSFAEETSSLICLKNNHKASSKLKFLKVDGQRLDMNNSSLDKYTNSPSRKLKSSVDLAALPNEPTKSNSDAKIKLNKSNTLIFEGVDNIIINKLNKKHENARASSNFENYPKLPSSLDEIKDKRFLKLPDLGSISSKPTTDPTIDEKINERIKKSPDLDVNVLVTEQDTNYFGPDKKNKGLSGSASRLKPSIQNAFAKLFSGRSYFGASSSNLNRNNTDLNLNGCIKVIVNEADEQTIAKDKDNNLAQHLLTKIDAKIYDDDQFDMEKENSTLDFNRMKGFQRKYVKIRTKAKPIKKQPNQPAKKVYVDAMTAVAAARDIKTPKDTPDVYESRNDVSKFYDHSKSLLNEGDKELNEVHSAKKQTDFKEKPVECIENKQVVPDVEEQTNEKVETDNNNNNSSTNNANTSTKAKETNKETSNRVKINYLTNKKSNLNSSSLRLSRANNEKFKEDFDEASLINLIYVTEAPLAKSTKFYTCQTSSTGQLKPTTNRKASLLGYNLADVSDKESDMSSMSDLEAELDAELQIEQIKNEFMQNEQEVNKLQKKIIKKMKVLNSDSMTYLNQPLKSNSLAQIQSQSLILNPTGEQSNANLNSNNPTSTSSNMYSYDVYKYYERTKIIKLNNSVGNAETKSVENVGEIREELNTVPNEKLSLIESLCESTNLEK